MTEWKSAGEKVEGEIAFRFLFLWRFLLLLLFAKLQQQLAGIGRACSIQPVVAAPPGMLDEGLHRLGVAQQIALNIGVDIVVVGLVEECTIHVIDVLANGLHAYASLTGPGKD